MPPRVSLCMIVKNEEANLPQCLGSAADLVQEIIVADTGSTDRTREVAKGFGARVVEFPWVDSFAAARNESVRHATGDWIFWMDADDRIDEENRERLRALFAGLRDENVAFMMRCMCKPGTASGTQMIVDHARLFRSHPEIRWRYRVHEQITLAVERLGGTFRWTDVIIHHAGYQNQELRRRKNQRNLRLLQLDYADNPHDAVTLFHLGWTNLDLGNAGEAVPYLRRTLEISPPGLSTTRKAHALLMNALYGLGQRDQALATCRQGRQWFPDDAELLFAEGKLLAEIGDLHGGEACLTQLLQMGNRQSFDAVDSGLFGYLAHYHLGEIYLRQGRAAEAESQFRQVLHERPEYTNAWLRLADIWSSQGRVAELAGLEETARRLEARGESADDILLLRIGACVGRKDFARAKEFANAAIAREPRHLHARVILSQVLLQEGRDWNAAERALHDVLAMDPNNGEARHNLGVLRQMLKR